MSNYEEIPIASGSSRPGGARGVEREWAKDTISCKRSSIGGTSRQISDHLEESSEPVTCGFLSAFTPASEGGISPLLYLLSSCWERRSWKIMSADYFFEPSSLWISFFSFLDILDEKMATRCVCVWAPLVLPNDAFTFGWEGREIGIRKYFFLSDPSSRIISFFLLSVYPMVGRHIGCYQWRGKK